MEGVRLYTSADAGAPVINGTDKGSLVRLLHACLVTGYGVKTAAGWTREWVKADETKAAFRNAGTGRYLWVEQNAEAPNFPSYYIFFNNSIAKLYDTLPDEDSVDVITWLGEEKICLSASEDGTARPWAMVANENFFFLICYIDATEIPKKSEYFPFSALLFGDTEYEGVENTDNVCCIKGVFFACDINDGNWKYDHHGELFGYVGNIKNARWNRNLFLFCKGTDEEFRTGIEGYYEFPCFCGEFLGSGGFASGFRSDIGMAAFRPAMYEVQRDKSGLDEEKYLFCGFLPSCYSPLYPVVFKPLEEVGINGEDFVTMSWGMGELLFKLAK